MPNSYQLHGTLCGEPVKHMFLATYHIYMQFSSCCAVDIDIDIDSSVVDQPCLVAREIAAYIMSNSLHQDLDLFVSVQYRLWLSIPSSLPQFKLCI